MMLASGPVLKERERLIEGLTFLVWRVFVYIRVQVSAVCLDKVQRQLQDKVDYKVDEHSDSKHASEGITYRWVALSQSKSQSFKVYQLTLSLV